MSLLLEMFTYPFILRAFAVGILVSLCAALLGVPLVLKRYSMIGDGLSHVSFGALALAPLEWIYYASAILIGFGFGIFIPTFQTMKLNMADRGHRGAVNSTFFTAFDIGVGTGMFLGGKIYAYLNLNWAFGAGALLNLLAIVYFYRISLDHYRKNKLGVDSD